MERTKIVRAHINKKNSFESHRSRDTSYKEYLENSLNLPEVRRLYVEKKKKNIWVDAYRLEIPNF